MIVNTRILQQQTNIKKFKVVHTNSNNPTIHITSYQLQSHFGILQGWHTPQQVGRWATCLHCSALFLQLLYYLLFNCFIFFLLIFKQIGDFPSIHTTLKFIQVLQQFLAKFAVQRSIMHLQQKWKYTILEHLDYNKNENIYIFPKLYV